MIEGVTAIPSGPGTVCFSVRANPVQSLRDLVVRILDPSGNIVQERQMAIQPAWNGQTEPFSLSPGTYRVRVQPILTDTSPSAEFEQEFSVADGGGPGGTTN